MSKEKQSEEKSIVGSNKPFLAYRDKLESLTIPKKGQDLDHKHLMLVGGSAEEAKPFVEDIKGLGFKKSIYVAWPDIDKEPPLKEKIYDSMYDYSYETDLFKNIGHASTANMLNKRRDDKRGAIRLSNYRLYILNNVSSVNNDLLCELVVRIGREAHRQYILIATVASQKEFDNLPETWLDLFEVISLDGADRQQKSEFEEKKIEGFAAFRDTQQAELWSIDKDKLTVYYNYENTKHLIRLTDRRFSVFCCLYEKRGSYVKIKTLEKCWKDEKPNYADFVKDCVSKIKNKIKQELDKYKVKNYGNIIEPDNPKNTKAYKLIP